MVSGMTRRHRQQGFTLLELIIVVAVIGILATIVMPKLLHTPDRAKEAVLRTDLRTLRDVIDQYYADKGKYPESLDVLVEDQYMRSVPIDPMTKSADTWVTVLEEPKADAAPPESDEESKPGIMDVHSGSDLTGSNGTPYSEW
jgi:general secretion pathway protein G